MALIDGMGGSGNSSKPVRQFSTRSRAKSTASFKGILRGHSHEFFDNETSPVGSARFASSLKWKSSDALSRKRAISGLNMTSLVRVRSHPSHIPRSHSSLNISPAQVHLSLKPKRSKSTRSVVSLEEPAGLDRKLLSGVPGASDNQDDQEYFTEEEDDVSESLSKDNRNFVQHNSKAYSGPGDKFAAEKPTSNGAPRTSVWSPQSSLDLNLIPNKPKISSPSVRASSRTPESSHSSSNSGNEFRHDITTYKKPISEAVETNVDNENHFAERFSRNHSTKEDDGHSNYSSDSSGLIDQRTHLQNELKNVNNSLVNDSVGEGIIELDNGGSIRAGHTAPTDQASTKSNQDNVNTHDQYNPQMILSQSTGMERTFEGDARVKNSLANEMRMNGTVNDGQGYSFHERNNVIGEPRDSLVSESDVRSNSTFISSKNKYSSNKRKDSSVASISSNTNLNDATSNNINNAGVNHFSSSISSLTTNLLKAAPDNPHVPSRLNNLFQRKNSNQFSMKSGVTDNQYSNAGVQHVSNSTVKFNDFAKYLNSDGVDGESRTQRKLWLQRENSIMDLSAQNVQADAIFMSNNIEVKREFERISHEYTNVKRFSNPLEAALLRMAHREKEVGAKNAKANTESQRVSTMNNSFLSGYGSANQRFQDILPKSEKEKVNRILTALWKEECEAFNKDVDSHNSSNKLRPSSSNGIYPVGAVRHSLRNLNSAGSGPHHQRTINSLQPMTRAVNRRMESISRRT